jgi:isopentenyl diphosphate isomerase/L-lactate dehydrogenase-like FMN-dependent dehydrogenase
MLIRRLAASAVGVVSAGASLLTEDSTQWCQCSEMKRQITEKKDKVVATGEFLTQGNRQARAVEATRLGPEEVKHLVSLASISAAAEMLLPEALRIHIAYGAEDDETVSANQGAWSRWLLRPRVLCNSACVSTRCHVLGHGLEVPVIVAPFATACACHPEGEIAIARGMHAGGSGFIMPQFGGTPFEAVKDAAGDSPLFLQLYPPRDADGHLDRSSTERAFRHVEAHGCAGIVVTVDTPVNGNREHTYRSESWLKRIGEQIGAFPVNRTLEGAGLPPHPGVARRMDWEDVRWLKSCAGDMKLVLKGVLTAEDASLAAEAGCDAIVVSNHGGRQLDGCAATAAVLEEVVEAVRASDHPSTEVLVDGGIRRGKDVFRALALGASGVLIGRPALYGLAVGGEHGVARVLSILRGELETVMELCGCTTCSDITRAHVRHIAAPEWLGADRYAHRQERPCHQHAPRPTESPLVPPRPCSQSHPESSTEGLGV